MKNLPMYDVNTHATLKLIHEYLCDGRIYLAREELEKLLETAGDE